MKPKPMMKTVKAWALVMPDGNPLYVWLGKKSASPFQCTPGSGERIARVVITEVVKG